MKIPKKGDEKDYRSSDSAGKSSGKNTGDIHFEIIKSVVERAVDELCSKLGISESQLLQLLKQRKEAIHVPVSIFSNKELSALELVCKYLKDELGIRLSVVAELLNRDYRTVWTTYANASRKHKARLSIPKSQYFFPTLILTNRKLSVLEAIVSYLKDELGLRFNEIAAALFRDQRNIWTVYRRAGKKLEGKNRENARTK